jgi:pentatricopeptide repeat protein
MTRPARNCLDKEKDAVTIPGCVKSRKGQPSVVSRRTTQYNDETCQELSRQGKGRRLLFLNCVTPIQERAAECRQPTNHSIQCRDAAKNCLDKGRFAIWFHIHKNTNRQEGAKSALLLLERLLLHQDTRIVSKGMVFNVLRAFQQDPTSSSMDTLEHMIPLLYQRNLLDAKLLNEILVAMTKCCPNDENAQQRAEAIIKNTTLSFIPVNSYHYCTVLNGYAKRGDAKKAEQLLQSMTDRNILLNTVAYNCVLNALTNSDEPKVVERAELLFKKMQQDRRTQPDMVTYTNMLNLYSKHAVGDKALELLERVMELEDTGKLKGRLSDLNYRCVIDALAKSGGAERAERLLDTMRTRKVAPNKFHYCGVLNGYAREGRPLEAERLLVEMKETDNVAPNTVAYNCAMYAWAKSGDVDAPFRARALVDRMLETDGVKPTVVTYNCLLGVLCASRAMAKESESLLKQMHELYESGDLEEAPNFISYNYVLGELLMFLLACLMYLWNHY